MNFAGGVRFSFTWIYAAKILRTVPVPEQTWHWKMPRLHMENPPSLRCLYLSMEKIGKIGKGLFSTSSSFCQSQDRHFQVPSEITREYQHGHLLEDSPNRTWMYI